MTGQRQPSNTHDIPQEICQNHDGPRRSLKVQISTKVLEKSGAVEKTRTSTGYSPTATSTLRVYQFRHDRMNALGNSKSLAPVQGEGGGSGGLALERAADSV